MAQGGDAGNGGGLAGVGPVVGHYAYLLGPDVAVLHEPHLDPHLHGHPGAATRQELLLPGVDDPHRLAGLSGQESGDDGVVVVTGLAAEPSSHGALDDAHVSLCYAQGQRDTTPGHEEGGGVHVDDILTIAVLGDAPDGFNGAMPLVHTLESILYDQVRLGEGALDIASLQVDRYGDVPLRVLVDTGCPLLHRLLGIEDGGKLLPLHFDELHRLLGDSLIDGGHCGDLIPHVAGLVHRKGELVTDEGAPALLDGVVGGDHGAHAGQPLRLTGVDTEDTSMRIRAPEDLPVQHPRKNDIRYILGRSGDRIESFDPVDPLPDHREPLCRCHSSSLRKLLAVCGLPGAKCYSPLP